MIQGVPVLLGDLGEVQEGIHDHGGGEQRAVLIQLHGVGNRLLAAQLGFLGRAQIGNPLLGGGRLRHVQLVQPVLADEQTQLGHIDAAGRDIILHLSAVLVKLTIFQYALTQKFGYVRAILRQQVVQRGQTTHVDILLHQSCVIGIADVRGGAAG